LSEVAQKETKNPVLGETNVEGTFYLPGVNYNKDKQQENKLNLATYLFKNQFATDCAYTSCAVLKSGCLEPLEETNLELSETYDLI